jgi:hypothetical protein
MKKIIYLLSLVFFGCSHPDIIVCAGNSLTQGQGAIKSYPEQLQKLVKGEVHNDGIGRQTTEQMAESRMVDDWYDKGSRCILVAWEVGNDIYFHGHPIEAVKRFEKYCNDYRAKGWIVIALTLSPRKGSVKYQLQLDTANSLLRVNHSSYCDELVDLKADPRLSKITLKYWNEDSIHLNDSGYAVVAELVSRAIKKLPPK